MPNWVTLKKQRNKNNIVIITKNNNKRVCGSYSICNVDIEYFMISQRGNTLLR